MKRSLVEIDGIGSHTAEILKKHGFASVEDVATATSEALQTVPGFGPSRTKTILEAAKRCMASAVPNVTVEPVKLAEKSDKASARGKPSKSKTKGKKAKKDKPASKKKSTKKQKADKKKHNAEKVDKKNKKKSGKKKSKKK